MGSLNDFGQVGLDGWGWGLAGVGSSLNGRNKQTRLQCCKALGCTFAGLGEDAPFCVPFLASLDQIKPHPDRP